MRNAPSRTAWTAYATVGVGLWLAVTVYVGATNDDPSDDGPVRTALVVGGAVFVAGLLTFYLRTYRALGSGAPDRLYERLALTPVSDADARAGSRQTASVGYVYVAAIAVIAALTFAAAWLGTGAASRVFRYAALGVSAVLGLYLIGAMDRAYRAGDRWLRPLGLRLTAIPSWIPSPVPMAGGVILVGDQAYSGSRHGRRVAIVQDTRRAVTVIEGIVPAANDRRPERAGGARRRSRTLATGAARRRPRRDHGHPSRQRRGRLHAARPVAGRARGIGLTRLEST